MRDSDGGFRRGRRYVLVAGLLLFCAIAVYTAVVSHIDLAIAVGCGAGLILSMLLQNLRKRSP